MDASDDATISAHNREPLFVQMGLSRLTETGEELRPSEPDAAFGERYERRGTIARGGMGEVIACLDLTLRREVALKRMRRRAAGRKGPLHRFVREAQITAQLAHPSIVPVYELGLDGDEPYFTMKRVEGQTLEEHIEELRRGIAVSPTHKRVRTVIQVCQAVSFAHSRGVLHRDLKPSNIMLGPFGEVLVMDWGLARLRDGPEEADAAEEGGRGEASASGSSSSISAETLEPEMRTRVGQALGTPMYMSPEQARGELAALDEGTDVYSLGAVLLSLLTLRRPVGGSQARAVIERVKRGEVERIAPEEGVPAELVAIVEKAMAFDRGRRYESVKALIADLEAYLSHGAVSAYQDDLPRMLAKWARRNRSSAVGLIAAGFALVLGLALASGWAERRREREASALLSRGAAALEKEDAALARELYARVLGLQPDSESARRGLEGAVLLGEQLRRRASREAASAQLRSVLPAAEEAHARPARGAGWYEAQSAALSRARGLAQVEEATGPGHRAVASLARRLGHQLAADESYAMAELMLREAEAAGIPAEAAAAERAFIERRQQRGLRQAVTEVRGALLSLRSREDEARGPAIDAAVARLLRIPHPIVAQLLLETLSDLPWSEGGLRVTINTAIEVACLRALEQLRAPARVSVLREPRGVILEELCRHVPRLARPLEALIESRLRPGASLRRDFPMRDGKGGVSADLKAAFVAGRLDLDLRDVAAFELIYRLGYRTMNQLQTLPSDPQVAPCLRILEGYEERLAGPLLAEICWLNERGSSGWTALQPLVRSLPGPAEGWPADRDGRLIRAHWHLVRGEHAEALAGLEGMEEVEEEVATALLELGRFDEAAAAAAPLCERVSSLPRGWLLRGEARLRRGDFEGAAEDLQRASARFQQPWRLALYAQALEGLERAGEALALYDRALAQNPELPELLRRRAELRERRGEWGQAIGDWSRLHELRSRDPEPLTRRGRAWQNLGQTALAEADAELALGIAPSFEAATRLRIDVAFALGRTAFGIRTRAAREAYDELVLLRAERADPELWSLGARVLLTIAANPHAFDEHARITQALVEAREAVALGGGDEARRLEAQVLERLGRPLEEAHALASIPPPRRRRDDILRLALAEVRGGLESEGLARLEALCDADPSDGEAAARCGEAWLALGRLEEAERALTGRIAALSGRDRAPWLVARARVRSRQRRAEAAFEDVAAAYALDPSLPEAAAGFAFAAAERREPRVVVEAAFRALSAEAPEATRAVAELALQVTGVATPWAAPE